jgi:integrase/recombinase XerD
MNTHFEIYLVRFIEWMKVKGWSQRTLESYTADIRSFIDYIVTETTAKSLMEIDAKVLTAFQTWLYHKESKRGKRLSLSSQHTKLVAVRTFFRFLYENDLIITNPAVILTLPKKRKSLPKGVLSEQQIEKLLEQPDTADPIGFRDRTILEVLYATGIRNSELRSLCVYDIDLKELQITIRKGKNAKDRMLPLGEIAADYLAEYLLTVRPKLNINESNQLLFISKNGRKITQANLVWIISKYVKKASLKGHITPHSLRHSCATHMLKHGADLRYVQEMLGHSSVATTQIYTRVEVGDLKAIHRRCHPREIKIND